MKHWAFYLIGQRWPESACFTFTREIVRNRLGVDLPDVDGVQASQWRRTPLAAPDDVVVMTSPMKMRHCGLWVETASRVGVLHAHGQVMFETLASLKEHGYSKFEFWRLHRA
jgi:cell wall-associated NlpC family hydrolase